MSFKMVTAFLVVLLPFASIFASPKVDTYQQTRELLVSLNDVRSDRSVLGRLFAIGDERIAELIKALDDPDQRISLRAQRVIRYLGNEAGMRALEQWYGKMEEKVTAGPLPIPLIDLDYKIISARYLYEHSDLYALALDGSERAQRMLEEVSRRRVNADPNSSSFSPLARLQSGNPRKVMTGEADLGKLVLANAFFMSKQDKQHASTELLALNGAKDKALIEINTDYGPLAEQWFHVVLRKRDAGWQFFSITLVAQS